MELERLEVLFDVNTQRVEEKLGKFIPKINSLLKKLETTSGSTMDKVEDNTDMSKVVNDLSKNLERMSSTFEKQMTKMENTTSKSATNVARNMDTGMKSTRTKAVKHVDLMVKDINARVGQAKAAQARIADLSAKRALASQQGESGQVVNYDQQIANAEKQVTSYRNSAIEMARAIKTELGAVPSSLKSITQSMDQNEARIEAMRRKIKGMQSDYQTQRKPVGGFNDTKTVDTPASIDTLGKIGKETAQMNKLISANDQLQRAFAQTEDRAKLLRSAYANMGNTLSTSSIKTGNAALGMKNITRASEQARKVWQRFGGLFNRVSNNIAHGARSVSGSIRNFFNSFNRSASRANGTLRSTSRNANAFGSSWGRTLYMLGNQLIVFTLMYRGIMALGTALWGSLKANDEFSRSLNQIQVNLLTAFYPIYQAVLPAINALMRALETLTGYFASFIATMFGTTYEAAKQGAAGLYENVQALDETGEGAKKAKEKVDKLQRSLMGFDEINRIGLADTSTEDETLDETGVNFGGAQNYSTPSWLTDFANSAKDIFSRLFEPIQAAWDKHGEAVMESFKYALDEIWELVKSIGRSFMEVWTNGSGERFVSNLLRLLTLVFNIIGDIARAFRLAWEENDRGTKLIQAIFDALNDVLELIIDIGETFRDVWNNGTGQETIGNILELLTMVFDIISDIAVAFREAWNDNNRGYNLIQSIFDALNEVLELLLVIGQTFRDVWNNGSGQEVIGNILELFTMVFDIIGDIARALNTAWTENERGHNLIQSIFDLMNEVIELILVMGESFREAWNDGSGVNILGDILEIVADIIQTFANLTEGIREAWQTNELGVSIMNTLLDIVENFTGAASEASDAMKDWAENVDFTPLMTSIDTLLKAFEPLTENVADGLLWIYEEALLPLSTWTIEDVLPAFLDVLSGALEVLNSVIDALKPSFKWLWDSFLAPITEWTGGVIVSVLEGIADGLSGISDWIDENQGPFATFVVAFASFAGSIVIIKGAMKAVSVVGGIFGWLSAMGGLSGVLSAVGTAIGGIVAFLGGGWVIAIALAIGAGVGLIMNWDEVKEMAGKLTTWIGEKWGKITDWTKETWDEVGKKVSDRAKFAKDNATDDFDELGGYMEIGWGAISTVTKTTWDFVADKVTNKASELQKDASSDVKTLKENIGKRWDDIKKNTSQTWSNFKTEVSEQAKTARLNGSKRIGELKTNIGSHFSNIWTNTKDTWDNVKNKVSDQTRTARLNGSKRFGELRTNIGSHFSNIWTNTKDTWNNVKKRITDRSDESKRNSNSSFKDMFQGVSGYMADIKDAVGEAFDTVADWAGNLGKRIGDGFNSGVQAVKTAAGKIGNAMVNVLGNAVNGVIKGINWVLGLVGSDTELSPWKVPKAPGYARGTDSHPGGPAMVNDGIGSNYQEAYQLPTGETGLFPRQRNMLVDLPRGSKVLSGEKTAKMYPHYANGIGEWINEKWNGTKELVGDVWNYISKPKELLKIALDKFIDLGDASGVNLDIAQGGIATMASNAVGFITDKLTSAFSGLQGVGAYAPKFSNPPFTMTAGYRDSSYHAEIGRAHNGIDFAAPIGTPIPANNKGIVSAEGPASGFGKWVVVEVAKDLHAIYGHISKSLVDKGDRVKKGQNIALVGNEGYSTGPHLHYELRKGGLNGESVNPETYGAKIIDSPYNLPGQGVQRWKGIATQALRITKQYSKSNLDALLYQMQTESGGDPKAINLWDINAQNGIPSKGLMQVIDPTFQANKQPGYNDIWKPLDNILASINYAVGRYGSLTNAYRGVGYENGGMVTRESYRVGENNKKEIIIPLERRNRALELLEVVQDYLGVDTSPTMHMPDLFIEKPTDNFISTPSTVGVSGGGVNNMEQSLIAALNTLANQNNQSNQPLTIEMIVNDKRLGQTVVNYINNVIDTTGTIPIKI